MPLFILFVTFVCVMCGLLYYWLTRTYSFWDKNGVASPKPYIFFGNIKDNMMGRKFISHVVADIYRQFPNEKYVGMYMIRRPVLIIRHLDLVKRILIKDFDCFSQRGVEFDTKGVGANLFHANVTTWSLLRKKLSPIFTSGKIKNMFYLVNDCADSFMTFMDDAVEQHKVEEIYSLTSRYTVSVISACAFGLDAKTMSYDYNMFIDYGRRIFIPSWKQLLETIFPGSLKRFNLSFFDRDIVSFFETLVKNIVKEREGKQKQRHDFMDLLLEMKEEGNITGNRVKTAEKIDMEVTEGVMTAQTILFFAAGFETSANTTAFILYELALNQDVQDKVVDEIDHITEKYGSSLTYDSLSELNYLDLVISETMRKYPIIDPLQRESVVDYNIPGTNVMIPKGTLVFIPVLAIHMDPNHWADPEKFVPERFLSENEKNRHSMDSLPFGNGPRMCIGVRFAMLQIHVQLARFFQTFRVHPCKNTPKVLEYTSNRLVLQPKTGIHLEIKRRRPK